METFDFGSDDFYDRIRPTNDFIIRITLNITIKVSTTLPHSHQSSMGPLL